ncbi:MAG: aspartate/glutamate racemase family protein [Geminicoccaceae bacterium]
MRPPAELLDMAMAVDPARCDERTLRVDLHAADGQFLGNGGNPFASDADIGGKDIGRGGDAGVPDDEIAIGHGAVSRLSCACRPYLQVSQTIMSRKRILVINPNSNEEVTASMSAALEPFRLEGGPVIDCMTHADGPFGIESQRDVESVALPLADIVAREKADAHVIACYSDPGLQVCREVSKTPVFGIAECGMLQAMASGDRFGVVAILDRSIPRHLRYMRQLGIIDRLAGETALDLRVHELADEARTWQRLVDVGRELVDGSGADVVLLGCAGMARYRERLEQTLARPVIDPTQAAVGMALSSVLLRPAQP